MLTISPVDATATVSVVALLFGSLAAVCWAVVAGWGLIRTLLEDSTDDD